MSYTSALSSAVRDWSKSPSTSLTTMSHMKPVTNYWSQSWHHAIIVIQTSFSSTASALAARSRRN
jgi:hypothetical protein